MGAMSCATSDRWIAYLDDVGDKSYDILELPHVNIEMLKIIPRRLVRYNPATFSHR
jgi:hypothetical protein